MKNIFSAFIRRTEGQVSVLMALAAVPLLIAAGAAIDRVRLDNARTEMQAAVDGAAMAAALAERLAPTSSGKPLLRRTSSRTSPIAPACRTRSMSR